MGPELPTQGVDNALQLKQFNGSFPLTSSELNIIGTLSHCLSISRTVDMIMGHMGWRHTFIRASSSRTRRLPFGCSLTPRMGNSNTFHRFGAFLISPSFGFHLLTLFGFRTSTWLWPRSCFFLAAGTAFPLALALALAFAAPLGLRPLFLPAASPWVEKSGGSIFWTSCSTRPL